MSNIKIGDRVIVTQTYSGDYVKKGMTGTAVSYMSGTRLWAVEFDKPFYGGHSCSGITESNRGRWVYEDILKVLDGEKDEKNVRKFHVGDIVVLKANSGYISFTAGQEGRVIKADTVSNKLLVMPKGMNNCCWFRASELDLKERLKPDWKIVIIPDGDKTTAKLYRNGKAEKVATVQRYYKDEYDVFTAADESVKKLFGKREKPESKKPGGYTGTAVSKWSSGGFTYGKVYSFKDGYTTDDYGEKRPCPIGFSNVDEWDEWIDKYFIKIEE